MSPHIVVVSKRKIFTVSTIIIAIVLVAIFISTSVVAAFGDAKRKIPIYSVDRQDKKISISFDAAWGADKTEKILDILDSFSIRATFFLVGFWVDKYPEMVSLIDKRGHEIGTHSDSHPKMSTLTKQQMTKELSTSMAKITAITNKPVTVFRPPFGDYNNSLIEVCDSLGLYVIQWDVDSLDWKDLSATEITGRVTKGVKNGSIVLFHNNSTNIVQALPMLLTKLLESGYTFTSIGNLIYKDNYIIDHTGRQIYKQS